MLNVRRPCALLLLCVASQLILARPTSASLVYVSSTFGNFTVTQNNASGFAATADIFESGVKAGVLEASVAYGGGTNPFNSGSLWGDGGFFRATGQSTNTNNLVETADGDWSFNVTPEPGWTTVGLTIFTSGTVIANPVFAGLTSDGTATVHDDQQGTPEELLNNYNDGDAFVNGDDLVFNAGTLATGITSTQHNRLWSYDSAGATSIRFTYEAGPVSNITNEGIAFDAQLRSTPEPSSFLLLGLAQIFVLGRRRQRRGI